MTRCILPVQLTSITSSSTSAGVRPTCAARPAAADPTRCDEKLPPTRRPIVSVRSYFSLQNLQQQWKELDTATTTDLGVVLILHSHFDGSLLRSLSQSGGGRLAIVMPREFRRTFRQNIDRMAGSIAGWGEVTTHHTVAGAMATMFHPTQTLKTCIVIRPEWDDPNEIYQEVGRQLTAG